MSYAMQFTALPARTRKRMRISEVFDIDAPDTALVEVYTDRTEYVPEINPSYVFTKGQVKKALQWLSGRFKKNLMLTGPTGCGKSSFVEQVAARLNIEVFRIGCHGKMEYPEMLGTNQLVNAASRMASEDDGVLKKAAGAIKMLFKGAEEGESLLHFFKRMMSNGVITQYQYGPTICAASRFDGGILLVDEVNFLHPSTIGGFNGLLDNGNILIPETGEIIIPKPGFRIAVTGNSLEGGDDMALHKGVQRMNVAFMNRFLTIRCDYMSATDEARHLGKVVSRVPGNLINAMIQTATDARAAYKNGIIGTVVSTRILETWAKLVESDQVGIRREPTTLLADTLAFALLDGADQVDAAAITNNLTKSIDDNGVASIPEGTPSSGTSTSPSGPVQVKLLVAENSGNPKLWGVYRASVTSDETLFYGYLSAPLFTEAKLPGFYQTNRDSKVSPDPSEPRFNEITEFRSVDAMADLKLLQDAYKLLIASSKATLPQHLASTMKELLPHLSRNDLLSNVLTTP